MREAGRYDQLVPSRESVLQVLQAAKPLGHEAIVARLQVSGALTAPFEKRLRAMLRDGQLLKIGAVFTLLLKHAIAYSKGSC